MPDIRKKILSTRALDSDIIEKAKAKGIAIDCVPFIDIHYKSKSDISEQMKGIQSDDIFIFTSQHAVKAVASLIENATNKTYCISGATYQALQSTNLTIEAKADYAADLVLLMKKDASLNYVLFCGDKRLPTIPHFLKEHNLQLLEVVCYENIASPQQISKQYDGILFYSPTGVESFFSVNNVEANMVFYCMGTTTANAISKRNYKNIKIAERPTIQALMDKIDEA